MAQSVAQCVGFFLALLACPTAYAAVLVQMKKRAIARPPVWSLFFAFGTVGGWALAFAVSPSGLTASFIVFLLTAAPLALLISSIRLLLRPDRSPFHRTAMWCGFGYPVLLAAGLIASISMAR